MDKVVPTKLNAQTDKRTTPTFSRTCNIYKMKREINMVKYKRIQSVATASTKIKLINTAPSSQNYWNVDQMNVYNAKNN